MKSRSNCRLTVGNYAEYSAANTGVFSSCHLRIAATQLFISLINFSLITNKQNHKRQGITVLDITCFTVKDFVNFSDSQGFAIF